MSQVHGWYLCTRTHTKDIPIFVFSSLRSFTYYYTHASYILGFFVYLALAKKLRGSSNSGKMTLKHVFMNCTYNMNNEKSFVIEILVLRDIAPCEGFFRVFDWDSSQTISLYMILCHAAARLHLNFSISNKYSHEEIYCNCNFLFRLCLNGY